MSEFPDLEVLQVRSFLIYHLGQELVFQTIPSHSEIDEGGLGLNLWLVVRIGQLGVEDESEAWVEETLLIPNFYTAVRERHEAGSVTGKMKAENKEGQIHVLWAQYCTNDHVFLVLPSLLDGVSSQQRVNNRVNCLLEVFYEDSVPCHYTLFYHIYITGTTINNGQVY